MKKKLILVFTLIIIVISVCIGVIDVNKEDDDVITKEFTYSIDNIPINMKEIHKLSKREQDIICATSKGLIEVDANGQIKASLSTGAEISEDGIEYQFNMNDNSYWSDGSKITAEDVVSFFKEIIEQQPREEIEDLYEIYGVDEFKNSEKESFEKVVGISAKDNKVSIRLNRANENFLKELSKPQYRIRKDIGLWDNLVSNYNKIKYSGQYSIKEASDVKLVLEKSKKETENILGKINILKEDEAEVSMAYFEVGERDIVVNPPRSQLNKLVQDNKVITLPSDESMYMVFNLEENLIPVEGRKELYNMFTKLIQEYQVNNSNFMELADGSYFREEKDNIQKLQERKVMSNSISEWEEKEVIYLLAENTAQNKEFCDFISEWFKKNTKMALVYNLVDKDILQNKKDSEYYDIVLVQGNRKSDQNNDFYKILKNYLPNKYGEFFVDSNTQEYEKAFKNMEDDLFNEYIFLPLAFYNNNIAVNKSNVNMELDINENIMFSTLKSK